MKKFLKGIKIFSLSFMFSLLYLMLFLFYTKLFRASVLGYFGAVGLLINYMLLTKLFSDSKSGIRVLCLSPLLAVSGIFLYYAIGSVFGAVAYTGYIHNVLNSFLLSSILVLELPDIRSLLIRCFGKDKEDSFETDRDTEEDKNKE